MSLVDRKTLAWIKEGVDETLKSFHHVPDDFLQNMEDISPIEAIVDPLHKVHGAVKMVGIQGAMLLASEMYFLASALVEGRVKQKKDAAEVLASAMLQLPGYLESLYHGQPDIPLILLPILNDLRACQDKELLTEGEFFSPNLNVNVPLQAETECIVSGDLPAVAKKLRPGYLSGLLGFIKEQEIADNIDKLILVLDNLKTASDTDKAKQLWWIALALVDSLKEESLERSVSIKILLGRIDRQIQRVIEHSEQILTDDPPNKIIKNLLYYVAQSQSCGDRVIQVKKSFGLDYPDTSTVESAREKLYGFNVNLVGGITEQINEELTAIKDSLDIALHAKAGSTEGLGTVLTRFGAIGDALGMLGMNKPKAMIDEQEQFLAPKIEQGETLSDEDLMGIAAALLHVESSMSDLGRTLDADSDDSLLPPAEYENLLKAVAKEALIDINSVKEHVEQFSLDPENRSLLETTPELMENIAGAMKILKYELQSDLSISIHRYIKYELMQNEIEVSAISLDLLADAITGLENFFQALNEESVNPDLGLHVATQGISQLGYPPGNDQDIPTLYPEETGDGLALVN